MPYINFKTILTTAFALIAIIIFKINFNDSGFFPVILIAALAGSIGGATGFLYDRYLEKYDYAITDIFDNIVWFLLFCIPGALIGVIISSLLTNAMDPNGTIILIVTIISAILLTWWKIKRKAKVKFTNNTYYEDYVEVNNESDETVSNENKNLKHPFYITEILMFFNLPLDTENFSLIKSSYREMIKKYHSDVGGSDTLTKRIIDNYKTLEKYFNQ